MSLDQALNSKKKMSAAKWVKGMIFANGLISSGYTLCFIPNIKKLIIPSSQLSNMNDASNTVLRSLLLGSLCLGVSNFLSLPSIDVAATNGTITSNICYYGIMIASNIYTYKKYPNSFNKNFYYFNIGLNTLLLSLSLYSQNKLLKAWPSKMNRAVGKLPKNTFTSKQKRKKRNSSSYNSNEHIDSEQERKEEIGSTTKKGLVFTASNYTKGLHEIKCDIGDDSMQPLVNHNLTIVNCKESRFKISQQLKSIVVENCVKIQVEIETEMVSFLMINCKECKVYLRKKCPIITVEKSDEPKLILFNDVIKNKPRIMSSMTSGFEIDAQKEDKEESEWKSFMIPYQLETQFDTENWRSKTVTVSV